MNVEEQIRVVRNSLQCLNNCLRMAKLMGDTKCRCGHAEARGAFDKLIEYTMAGCNHPKSNIPCLHKEEVERLCKADLTSRKTYVLLESLEGGHRFFTSNMHDGSDPTKLNTGEVVYKILGYADTIAEAQNYLYGQSFA